MRTVNPIYLGVLTRWSGTATAPVPRGTRISTTAVARCVALRPPEPTSRPDWVPLVRADFLLVLVLSRKTGVRGYFTLNSLHTYVCMRRRPHSCAAHPYQLQ
jgi:hypothetical protein